MSDLDENVIFTPGDPGVPILITCEHAGNAVPADLELGIPREVLDAHWGWDRWAYETLQRFAGELGATTVATRVSRLVLDANRGVEDATLIVPDAGGVAIPGNQGLSPDQVAARVARFHTPYHAVVDRELRGMVARFGRERVVFFTFHSFTGSWAGQDRDFDVGVLFDAHEDLAAGVKRALQTRGLRTRLNEPYSGYRGQIYSAARHGEAHDVAYFELELNQDVLEDPAQRDRFARVLRQVVPAIFPHLPCY
ncbi:MAG: N-formylglutamate amidohydrolase [Planctomycetota bacterium]